MSGQHAPSALRVPPPEGEDLPPFNPTQIAGCGLRLTP